MKKAREIIHQRVKLIVFGATKSGKSTFLKNLTQMKGSFLSGVQKETSNFWQFMVSPESSEKSIIFTEISTDGTKID